MYDDAAATLSRDLPELLHRHRLQTREPIASPFEKSRRARYRQFSRR